MTLLELAFDNFTVINKAVVDDGYGGVVTTWVDGAVIKGAMGAKSAYTFTVRKSLELDYHTVLRRESDGKIFRLTSNTDDKKTPPTATLDMRQYTAEEWELV